MRHTGKRVKTVKLIRNL